jgi:nucleoside-diphosphate-sugar epimerase
MGYIGPCVIQRLRSILPDATLIEYRFFCKRLDECENFARMRGRYTIFCRCKKFTLWVARRSGCRIHLAAISNDPMGNQFEDVTFEINYRASIRLAKSAKKAGVNSFVFASSCSMYGTAEDEAQN